MRGFPNCGCRLTTRKRRGLRGTLRVEKENGFDYALVPGVSLTANVNTGIERRTRRLELMRNTRDGNFTVYSGQGIPRVLQVIGTACSALLRRFVRIIYEILSTILLPNCVNSGTGMLHCIAERYGHDAYTRCSGISLLGDY